eukprot:TRINITY_DN3599_c0_g1_i3.p1 TRINITY_DN3599_c0_g1~~TRINITY_DN3599_c0_g1_i3.p1  ORF type:complete len:220 (+),score=30.77 TRINITY_DN3599_c0_g1_i3:86-745(+)
MCTFFLKTGACKYGPTCKRAHIVPLVSETILVDQMFRDQYSRIKNVAKGFDDSLIEIDEEEVQKKYDEFYEDVLPEFEKYGKISQFKCCNNLVPHLRGNLYIQYVDVVSAIRAYIEMDNRFYAGYQIRIHFSLIKDWKQAICAYNGQACPKYSECNFLHVFRNPNGAYSLPFEGRSREKRTDGPRHHHQGGGQSGEHSRRDRDRSRSCLLYTSPSPRDS